MTKAEVKAKVSTAIIQYVAPAEEVEIAGIESALDVAIKAYKAAELEYAKFVDLQVAVDGKDAELVNKINELHKAITKTEGTYKRSLKRETLEKLNNRLFYLREELKSAMVKKRFFDGFKNHFDNARTDAYKAKCKTANEVTKVASGAGYKFIVKIKTTKGEIKKYVRSATQAAGMIYQYSDVLVRWDILTVDEKYRPAFGYKNDGSTQSKLENFIDETDEKYIDAEILETTTAKGEVTISNDEEGFKTIAIRSIHNFTLGNYTESIDELKNFVAKASGELRTKALAELQVWINITRAEGVEVEDYAEVEENTAEKAENTPVDAPNTSEGTNDSKTAEDTLKDDFSANDGQSGKISYQDLRAKIQVSYRVGKNGRENKIWGMYRNGGHIYNTGFIKVDHATAKKLLEENGWTVKEFVKADKAAKKAGAKIKAYNDAKSERNMAGVAMTNSAKIEKAAEYYGLTVEELQEILEKVSAENSAAKNSTVEDTTENVTFAHVKKGTGEYSCQVFNNESLIKICGQILNPDALKFIDSYITALAGKMIEYDERLTYEGNNNIRINYHVENLNNGGLYIRCDIANIETGTISISTTNSDNGKQILTAEDVEKVIESLNLKPQTSDSEKIVESTLDEAEPVEEKKYYAVSYTGYNSIRSSEKEFNSAIEAYKFLKKKIRKYSGSTYWNNQIDVQFLENGKLKFETIYENGVEIEERTTDAEIQALIDAENAEIKYRLEINEINNCIAYWACECAVAPEAMEVAVQAEIENAAKADIELEENISLEDMFNAEIKAYDAAIRKETAIYGICNSIGNKKFALAEEIEEIKKEIRRVEGALNRSKKLKTIEKLKEKLDTLEEKLEEAKSKYEFLTKCDRAAFAGYNKMVVARADTGCELLKTAKTLGYKFKLTVKGEFYEDGYKVSRKYEFFRTIGEAISFLRRNADIFRFFALYSVEETKNGFHEYPLVSGDMKSEYEINTAEFDELIKEYGEKTVEVEDTPKVSPVKFEVGKYYAGKSSACNAYIVYKCIERHKNKATMQECLLINEIGEKIKMRGDIGTFNISVWRGEYEEVRIEKRKYVYACSEYKIDAEEKTVEVKIYDSAATNDLANISYLMQARELENEYRAEKGNCLVNQVAQWNIQEQAQTLKNIAAVGKDFLLMYLRYKISAKEYHEASVEKMHKALLLDDQLQKEGAQVQRFDTLYWKNANAGKSKTAEKYAMRYDEHYAKYNELREKFWKLNVEVDDSRLYAEYYACKLNEMENYAVEYVKNQPVTIEVDAEEIEPAKIEEVEPAQASAEHNYSVEIEIENAGEKIKRETKYTKTFEEAISICKYTNDKFITYRIKKLDNFLEWTAEVAGDNFKAA